MNLTIIFVDYFYSKYYCGRSAASADAKGEAMDPAPVPLLDFGKRNGYLKGVAPINAQQKSMEPLTFSCSRGSS